MKNIVTTNPPWVTIAGYQLFIIALAVSISLIVPAAVMAQELVTYEGTIQGLNCVHYQQKCPDKDLDMYIALEHDFVLLLPDGSHFLLPNLDRGIKARYLTKEVRIHGKQRGTTIWVENLEAKEGQRYRLMWDIQTQRMIEQAP